MKKQIITSLFIFLLLSTTTSATVLPDAFQGYYNQSFVDADITDFEKALVGTYTDVSVSIPGGVDGVQIDENDVWDYSDGAFFIYSFKNNTEDLLVINNG